MDTAEENCFDVHGDDGVVKFELKDGVCVHKPSENCKQNAATARESVEQGEHLL